MGDSFKQGMVVTVSNWGSSGKGMSWLDSPPCSTSTKCTDGAFTVKDFAVDEIGAPVRS